MSKRCREPEHHREVRYCLGPKGATGATGVQVPSGVNYSDYLFWDGSAWVVGDSQVHLGASAGQINQGAAAVAIGQSAGQYSQATDAIAIGHAAGQGTSAGVDIQDAEAIAIGLNAGKQKQGTRSIAIGSGAGATNQEYYSVAIGYQAGKSGQGDSCIAIGTLAGNTGQSDSCIAIGNSSGRASQGAQAVAIGVNSGNNGQGTGAVAIGVSAGLTSQGTNAVAIGPRCGYTLQGQNSVAIGYNAGSSNLGAYSVAIGNYASAPVPMTIVLNGATGPIVPTPASSGFYVFPVASTGATGVQNGLHYNPLTREIGYQPFKSFVIDHPLDPERYLVHACLEGPEAGVYYRGEAELVNGKTWVDLPTYVSELATEFTVQLTQISRGDDDNFARLRAGRVIGGRFAVYGDPCLFAWHVYGLRQKVNPEPLKAEVNVVGDGPYRYIQ